MPLGSEKLSQQQPLLSSLQQQKEQRRRIPSQPLPSAKPPM